jgi:hypothetical protein
MLRNWVEIWFSYKEKLSGILATTYPRKHIILAILKFKANWINLARKERADLHKVGLRECRYTPL